MAREHIDPPFQAHRKIPLVHGYAGHAQDVGWSRLGRGITPARLVKIQPKRAQILVDNIEPGLRAIKPAFDGFP